MTGGTPQPLEATAVVLAGGRSSRMGRDKAFLDLDGKPLIARVIEVLRPLFREVLVSGPDRPPYRSLDAGLVTDIVPDRGPLSGLHAGLSAAAWERVFLCACDMPFIEPALVRFLYERSSAASLVVPRGPDGLEPLFAFYRRSCLPTVASLLERGALSIHRLPEHLTADVVGVEAVLALTPGGLAFRNVNRPQEYEALLAEFRRRKTRSS